MNAPVRPAAPRPAATDTCRVCAPLGAVLAFRGLAGCVPLVHGSQGCATYIRRYLISHFREPVDVGSTSFSETSTIFGGQSNLEAAIANLAAAYRPALVGLCTTCLAETIGEDTRGVLDRLAAARPDLPPVLAVSTPSFRGDQHRGFHDAVKAILAHGLRPAPRHQGIGILPGPLSPADLRHLREIAAGCGAAAILLPDYSDTLDGPSQAAYQPIPDGGTTAAEIAALSGARTTIQLGATLDPGPAAVLAEAFQAPVQRLGVPIGVVATDTFVAAIGGRPPAWLADERGRLIDAYVDGHKYVASRTALVAGDPDLVAALAEWCREIGIAVTLAATGAATDRLAAALPGIRVAEDQDWERIAAAVADAPPDLILGPSKAYPLARRLGRPLVRVGFPIHDRIGAGRLLHVGYRGTQRLFDAVVNTLLERQQDESEVGHAYQ